MASTTLYCDNCLKLILTHTHTQARECLMALVNKVTNKVTNKVKGEAATDVAAAGAVITVEEIKNLLVKEYHKTHGGNVSELSKRKVIINYGDQCVFFELEGWPPHGYAIWATNRRLLTLINSEGESFKIFDGVYTDIAGVTDLGNAEPVPVTTTQSPRSKRG